MTERDEEITQHINYDDFYQRLIEKELEVNDTIELRVNNKILISHVMRFGKNFILFNLQEKSNKRILTQLEQLQLEIDGLEAQKSQLLGG